MTEEKEAQETEREEDAKQQENQEAKPSEKDEKIAELTSMLQRVQADFENHRKRTEKEIEQAKIDAKAEIVEQLLPVIDTFELAFKKKQNQDTQEFIEGIELIYAELHTTLQKNGLRPIEAEGDKLDPNIHEVLMRVDSDEENNTVIEELQKGYMLNDRVLRTSKVKIARQKTGDSEGDAAQGN